LPGQPAVSTVLADQRGAGAPQLPTRDRKGCCRSVIGVRIGIFIARAALVAGALAGLVGCATGRATPTPTAPLRATSTPVATLSPTAIVVTPTTAQSPTPTPTATPSPPPPNPLLSRGQPTAPPESAVVDGHYCGYPAWHATTFPTTIAIHVGTDVEQLLLSWNSAATTDYVVLGNAPTYGIPADYTIAVSTDSTDGSNGTWREVVRVQGNTARTRAHRFPAAGAAWVRMMVTALAPGTAGGALAIDELDIHDASRGAADTVFFMGDSITAAAFSRCDTRQPSFAELVHRAAPGRFPAMIDGGVGGTNSAYGLQVVNDWLALNPDFAVWAIGFGTNDAWQGVAPAVFEQQLEALVERISAAGRRPVLARIPYATGGPPDANVQALNAVIDRVTARDQLLPGPNLYAWFKANPGELGPDGVHPTDAGARSINRLWYEALRPLYGAASRSLRDPDDPRRLTGDDRARWDIFGHDHAGADNGVVANRDTFEHERAAAEPDAVADVDRLRHRRGAADPVLIGIHDHDVPGDLAVAADSHLLLGDNLSIAVQIGAVADADARAAPAFQAHSRIEGAIRGLDIPAIVPDDDRRPPWFPHQQSGSGERTT
jgi:acyl-CoA thioesterase-1